MTQERRKTGNSEATDNRGLWRLLKMSEGMIAGICAVIGVILGAGIENGAHWAEIKRHEKDDAVVAKAEMIARVRAAQTALRDARSLGPKDTNYNDRIKIAEDLMSSGEATSSHITLGDWPKLLSAMKRGELIDDKGFEHAAKAFGNLAGLGENRDFWPTNTFDLVAEQITNIDAIIPK